MAKRISDELIDLKIIVNGDEAQKRVADLEKENNKLSRSIDEQREKMRLLSRQRKTDSEEYKKAQKEVERLSKAISDNNKKIDEEVKAMNIMSLTMQQLQKRANDLRFVLSHMAPGTAAYKSAQEELSKLNSRMNELRSGSSAATGTLSGLADKFNHYSGIVMAASATLLGIGVSIQQTIDLNNKMADAQTAVAKTTGLTNEQVKELTRSFSEFDTRTKNIDLLKIAEIGGRLGVPKNEIKEFTREVDKAYVALGDSFSGGVEQVAEKIGKIKGLFKETKDLDMATAINQIGSSMNELGASGAASEANIAEFATRVGALPDSLKPTVAEALALGAAFEESGIDAERSATAYSNFVRRAAQDAQAFANIMNIPVEKVKEMVNTDPTAFFLKFSEGLKGLDATEIAAILDQLKLNDQYLTSIVGSAMENTERFRKSIEQSNQSLTEATSLQEEFNKVNNNAAAIYDKVRKKFVGMFASETVANTLNWLIATMGKLLGVVEDTSGTVTFFKNSIVFLIKTVGLLTAAIITNNLFTGVYNGLLTSARDRVIGLTIVEKARNLVLTVSNTLMTAGRAIMWLFAAGYSLLTGNVAQATLAMRGFTAAIMANPIGAAITLLTTLIAAYVTYTSVMGEAESKQKSLNDVMNEGAANARKETNELDSLYRKATMSANSIDKRREAAEKLQKLYPAYFGNIDKEIIMNGKARDSYLKLRDSILVAARARAAQAEIDKREQDRLKYDLEWRAEFQEEIVRNANLKKNKDLTTTIGNVEVENNDLLKASNERIKKKIEERKQWVINNRRSDKPLYDIINKATPDISTDNAGSNSNYNVPTGESNKNKEGTGSKKKTEAEKAAEKEKKMYDDLKKKILDGEEQYAEKLMDLHLKIQESKIEMMDEGYEKELAKIRLEERKKYEELQKQKYSQAELDKLDSIISKESGKEKEKFQKIKAEWVKHNNSLTELQLREMKLSNIKIKILDEKMAAEKLKEEEALFYKKMNQWKIQENERIAEFDTVEKQKLFLLGKISEEEYNKIRTWEEGKRALQKYFHKEALKEQKEYLGELIKGLEKIPTANLTKEQSKALDDMRLKLSDINAELAEIRDGEQESELSTLSNFGGKVDLFGLNQEQWEAMFSNFDSLEGKIQRIGAALSVAKNMLSTYHEYAKANQEAELRRYEVAHERKKRALEAQLAAGIISQQEYKHQTLANENDMAMKKYQLELDAAKREKTMKIADTVSNTAMAIMSIWSKKAANPIIAAALTAMVTALGAVQVATISRQPLPAPPSIQGAEDGYYPVIRKQDGKLFNARKKQSRSGIYDEPTMLVGEQGKNFPELVVSGRAMKRIDPKLKNDFMNEVARVEGFEKGLYPTPPDNTKSDDVMRQLVGLISENIVILNEIKQNGITAYIDKTARNGKDMREMIKEYERILNKNKH